MSTAWQGCELKMGLTGLSVMRAYTGVCLHSSWANPQSQRFRWLGWPQLTDWEIPCFQKLFQTLLLLQAYWFYCHSQRITSDITRELSKEASRVLILLLDWALSLHNLSNYCFKTVTRIIGWLSISLMNAILHRAHSSGNKHIPALPLALSANSCLKNLLTSELWMFLRMTWGPPAHQPHRNSLGDTDESLGEPKDEQFSPWPHWHNNKASELILPILEVAANTCMYCIFHFLNSKASAAMEGGQGKCQSISLSFSSSLDSPSSGSKQSWRVISWGNNWKPSPSSGSTDVGHTLIPVPHLLGLHIQAKFCTGLLHHD